MSSTLRDTNFLIQQYKDKYLIVKTQQRIKNLPVVKVSQHLRLNESCSHIEAGFFSFLGLATALMPVPGIA